MTAARVRDEILAESIAASPRAVDAGMVILRRWAATGEPFSANDVRAELRDAGVEAKTTGALFNAAIKAGVLVQVGLEQSTDPGTHAKRIALYRSPPTGHVDVCDAPGCTKPTHAKYRHCRMHTDRLWRYNSYDLPAREFTSNAVPGVELRAIPGHGDYAAGDDGHIYSVGRRWRTGSPRRLAERPNVRDGYLAVALRVDGKTIQTPVHRLITGAFHGARPEGTVRRHLDGDKTNNRPSNLAYGTPQSNSDDMQRHGTVIRGQAQHRATVSDDDVELALRLLADGATLGDVAERYGVHPETVMRWRTGQYRSLRADGTPIEIVAVPVVRDETGRFTSTTPPAPDQGDDCGAPVLFDI